MELEKILQALFASIAEGTNVGDPIQFLERLSTVIPLASLEGDIPGLLEEAKGMLEEAKLYLQLTQEKVSPTLRARLTSVLEGIVSLLEGIIQAFGIGEFFKPAESDLHADSRSHKIMMLLSLFSMITALLFPILGAATGGLIVGGTLLSIAVLSALWPLVKPIPTHLPANAENWTRQLRNGRSPAQGRRESLDAMANILKMNRHAILVGPSRVGKSLTAKAFAEAVARGDYPELKGKVVFRINTTDLIGQQASFLGGGNTILNKISAAMGRHRKNIILVLDEIHMACKNQEKIADQLKTFLDEEGEFPHVIGITTEEEYTAHVRNNQAFSLRFDRVDIQNTSRDETLRVLGETLLRSRSRPLIQEDALEHIYNRTSRDAAAPQPATALRLLKQLINRTEKTQQSPTEKRIIEVAGRILALRSQAAATRGKRRNASREISALEEQMRALQETIQQEHAALERLFHAKNLFDRTTQATYASILKISGVASRTLRLKEERELSRFLLLRKFLGQALESHIQARSEALRIKTLIDAPLIEEVANA